VNVTRRSFVDALARVYQEPHAAYDALVARADRDGPKAALNELRDRPEQFGTLLLTRQDHVFGLVRADTTAPARHAAVVATPRGREHLDAVATYWSLASATKAHRLGDAFAQDLAALYLEPVAARRAFVQLAMSHGLTHAAGVLAERPREIGTLSSSIEHRATDVDALARRAAVVAIAALEAQAMAAGPARYRREPLIESELAFAQQASVDATAHARSLHHHAQQSVSRGRNVHGVTRVAAAALPRDVSQLGLAFIAPGVAASAKVRAAIRDVVLGSAEERER
jgi:hypothetical protein